MKLHDLRAPEGSTHRPKRVGRGHGSGHGKTSGRGTKGQNARGQGFRLGFEGGQMSLAMRLPKLGGFKNQFKIDYAIINLSKLSAFKDGSHLTPESFYQSGHADAGQMVKVLGAGKLRRKLTIEAHAFSESARAAIEARGGSVVVIGAEAAAEKAQAKAANDARRAGKAKAAGVARAAKAAAAPPEESEAPAPAKAGRASTTAEPASDGDQPGGQENAEPTSDAE